MDHFYLRGNTEQLADIIAAMARRDPELAKCVSPKGDGKLPLHRACFYAHSCNCCQFELPIKLLKVLAETYPEPIQKPDNLGDLPLHIASRLRCEELITYFLDICIQAEPPNRIRMESFQFKR